MEDVSNILREISEEKRKLSALTKSIMNLKEGRNTTEEIDSFDMEKSDPNSEWKSRYLNSICYHKLYIVIRFTKYNRREILRMT